MIEVTQAIRIVANRHADDPMCVCDACLAVRVKPAARTLPGYGPRQPKAVKAPPDPRVSGLPVQHRDSAVDLRTLSDVSLLRVLRALRIGLHDVASYDNLPPSTRDDITALTRRMGQVLDILAERISPPATEGGSEI